MKDAELMTILNVIIRDCNIAIVDYDELCLTKENTITLLDILKECKKRLL